MRERHLMISAVLGLCLFGAVACGGDTTASPDGAEAPAASDEAAEQTTEQTTSAAQDSIPDGFKRVGSKENGVSIAVPDSWVTLDLSKDDLERGLTQSGLSGAALEQAKQGLQVLVSSKAVWASDPKSAEKSSNGFTTNLNGYCQQNAGASADQLISAAKEQLKQLKAKVTEASEVAVDQGKAVRITYSFPTGGVNVQGTQYYVPGNGKTCIVTLSTDQNGQQKLFDQIGKTARPI
jgi:hypothetical protein